MLETLGVDRIVSVDLQPPGQGQIEGFFSSRVPVDNLRSTVIAVNHFAMKALSDPVVVAANETCIEMAQDFRVRFAFIVLQFIHRRKINEPPFVCYYRVRYRMSWVASQLALQPPLIKVDKGSLDTLTWWGILRYACIALESMLNPNHRRQIMNISMSSRGRMSLLWTTLWTRVAACKTEFVS